MLIEVFKPFETELISSPPIIAKGNRPVSVDIVAFVPGLKMILAYEDNEQ